MTAHVNRRRRAHGTLGSLRARLNRRPAEVFQAGSTLTTGSGSRVVLTGGAQACNVFWQVGSSATIGTDSAFAGTILALTSVTLTTGATLNGRALARNGAVTLDTNTITKTACATAPSGSPVPSGTPAPADTTGASARLRGPQRCVDNAFRARVSGRQISRVTFFVDAKRRRTINATAGQTVFSLRINPARQNRGVHRITAKVRFTDSAAKTRTLRLVYQRCSKAAVRPRFTG
jgi:Ice-binding-like